MILKLILGNVAGEVGTNFKAFMKKIMNIKLATSKSTKQSVSVEGESCVAEFSGVPFADIMSGRFPVHDIVPALNR
jgi:hypothetical protein